MSKTMEPVDINSKELQELKVFWSVFRNKKHLSSGMTSKPG